MKQTKETNSKLMRRLETERRLILATFELNRPFQTDLDLEQFLRASNLPFAIEEYVRAQNARSI